MEKEVRESFVFYRSFYEAIKDLPDNSQLEVYRAICELSLNFEEIELKGLSNTIFKLIKPQLNANNKKYINGCKGKEYGKLGGRPKKPQENPKDNPKKTPNENDNENVNENDNDNDTIYSVVESELNITLSPMNFEKINRLIEKYGENKFKEALMIASNGNKKSLNYVEGILKNNTYKQNNPEWLDKNIKKENMNEEEMEDLKKLFEEFK